MERTDIDRLKDHNPVSDVLARYGFHPERNGKTRCPFHAERIGSLSVTPLLFYCFGCGVGGDVIKLVMLLENTDFQGAVRLLEKQRHRVRWRITHTKSKVAPPVFPSSKKNPGHSSTTPSKNTAMPDSRK